MTKTLLRRIVTPYVCRRCVSTLRSRLARLQADQLPPVSLPGKVPKKKDRQYACKYASQTYLRSQNYATALKHDASVPLFSIDNTSEDAPQASAQDHVDAQKDNEGPAKPKKRPGRRRMKAVPSKTNKVSPADTLVQDSRSSDAARSDHMNAVVDIKPPVKIPVPRLAHGLDRVLFNPGVYYLQDPRSNVYNFDPYLQEITPVKDFNFDALTEYITSSRDPTLDELARSHDLQIVGSTSSMTGVLSQLHYFISNWRPISLRRLSTAFKGKSQKFTQSQRAPASIYLRHNDGIYAIDADKSLDSGETVLSFLGRSMEKMLTLDQKDFSKLKKENSSEAPTEKSREAYHYSKIGKILMRSQLDCNDPRLPGTGTFDLKTRAVLPVRMDVKNAHEGAGYQIHQSTGLLESFEREYYDMIRAAFLKYSLQVRIGKMDGIFVAYHNTERIFGFQYISLEEMDDNIHGSSDRDIASREFVMSLKQLDKILEIAIQKYPGQSMALSFETSESKTPEMNIVIEPLEEAEIKRRQNGELLEALKAAQQNERIRKMPSSEKSTNSKGTLESMSSTLEKIILKSEKKLSRRSEAPQQAGNPSETSEASAASAALAASAASAERNTTPEVTSEETPRPRTMLRLLGTNIVDGKPVKGSPEPTLASSWQFKFTIKEITSPIQIDKMLQSIMNRQAQAFTDIYEDESRSDGFLKDLKRMSDLGRLRLEEQKEKQPATPVVFRESLSSSRDLEREYRRNFL